MGLTTDWDQSVSTPQKKKKKKKGYQGRQHWSRDEESMKRYMKGGENGRFLTNANSVVQESSIQNTAWVVSPVAEKQSRKDNKNE